MPDGHTWPGQVASRPRHASLTRLAHACDRALGALEQVTLMIACVALAAIMLILFLDGSLRYLLNSPLTFAMDVVTLYLLSAALLLTMSYTLRCGGHISVDLFANMMNKRLQILLLGAAFLCALPIIGIMSYEMTVNAWNSWLRGERLVGLHALPLWLSRAIVALSFALLGARTLHLGMCNLISGLTGNEDLAYPLRESQDAVEREAS